MGLKKQILSYSAVNILNAGIPFFLLPILTKYLEPKDYGILSLFQLLMTIIMPFVSLDSHSILIIEYSKLSFEQFRKLLSTIIWLPIVGFLFMEFLFSMFNNEIIKYFHIPQNYIYLLPLFVLFQIIPMIVPLIFQAKKEPINFGKYKLSMTIANVILSLIFVVGLGYGWEGRLWGIVLSFLIFTIIGVIILIRQNLLILAFDKKFLKQTLSFGIPLIPHTIAGTFLVMSDRIFLANMVGDSAVGIYSVAFQIASGLAIIFSSVNQAWVPNLYEFLNSNPTLEDKLKIVKKSYKIAFGMVLLVLVFMILMPFLYNIFINIKYHYGKTFINFIAIAFLFQGFYFLVTNYIFYSKQTKILSSITVFSTIVIFLCNYLFINYYGIKGSAYAMLFGWIIQFLIVFIIANRLYPMPWRLKI